MALILHIRRDWSSEQVAEYSVLRLNGNVVLSFSVRLHDDGSPSFVPHFGMSEQALRYLGVAIKVLVPHLNGGFPEGIEVVLEGPEPEPRPAMAAVAGVPMARAEVRAIGRLVDSRGRFGQGSLMPS